MFWPLFVVTSGHPELVLFCCESIVAILNKGGSYKHICSTFQGPRREVFDVQKVQKQTQKWTFSLQLFLIVWPRSLMPWSHCMTFTLCSFLPFNRDYWCHCALHTRWLIRDSTMYHESTGWKGNEILKLKHFTVYCLTDLSLQCCLSAAAVELI